MQKVGGELPNNIKKLKVYGKHNDKNNNNAFERVLKRLRSAKNPKPNNNYNTAFTKASIYGNNNLSNVNHSTKRSRSKNGGGKTKRRSRTN
jgi:hypothetical protein